MLQGCSKALGEAVQQSTMCFKVHTFMSCQLSRLLPRNRSDLYAFLALVIAAIQLILSTVQAQDITIPNVDIDINQLISVTVNQNVQPVPKVGRNEPCPCGSGKKYKKCHGDPVRYQQN
jgi:hypothetical protein